MNSYQTIISELIKQKQLLDEKGYSVNVANTNPSPSEITNAIEKISFDFTVATATEADVFAGKTFFAQNNELKTGTFSQDVINGLKTIIRALVAGDIPSEFIIPEYCQNIRPYAFYIYNQTKQSKLFVQENLIIPSQIKEIGLYAFYNAQISNKLYVPKDCVINASVFQYGTMYEVEFAGIFSNGATYAISFCPNLKKITFLEPFTSLVNYCCIQNANLEEIYFPTTFKTFNAYAFEGCRAIKFIKFTSTNPPTFGSNSFKSFPTAKLLVPYLQYYDYYNTTNILYNNNPIIGYGEFKEGATLPTRINNDEVVWYPTSDDAVNGTNSITVCPATGTMYMTYPPVVEDESTDESIT